MADNLKSGKSVQNICTCNKKFGTVKEVNLQSKTVTSKTLQKSPYCNCSKGKCMALKKSKNGKYIITVNFLSTFIVFIICVIYYS